MGHLDGKPGPKQGKGVRRRTCYHAIDLSARTEEFPRGDEYDGELDATIRENLAPRHEVPNQGVILCLVGLGVLRKSQEENKDGGHQVAVNCADQRGARQGVVQGARNGSLTCAS